MYRALNPTPPQPEDVAEARTRLAKGLSFSVAQPLVTPKRARHQPTTTPQQAFLHHQRLRPRRSVQPRCGRSRRWTQHRQDADDLRPRDRPYKAMYDGLLIIFPEINCGGCDDEMLLNVGKFPQDVDSKGRLLPLRKCGPLRQRLSPSHQELEPQCSNGRPRAPDHQGGRGPRRAPAWMTGSLDTRPASHVLAT